MVFLHEACCECHPKAGRMLHIDVASIESTLERSRYDGHRTGSHVSELDLAKLAAVLMHIWHEDE